VLLQQPPAETFTHSVLEHWVYPALQEVAHVPVLVLQVPDPLVTWQSAFVQHCDSAIHAPLQTLKPVAHRSGPPHAPDVHVKVPWGMGQSVFEQHCAHVLLQLRYPLLQAHPQEPAVHWPVAFVGTPAVHDEPSGLGGYVVGHVPVEVLHETAR
jgi:hypothetical protein